SRSGAGSSSTPGNGPAVPPATRIFRFSGERNFGVLAQADARFDVQCGQRFAAAGIVVAHHTHSFVTGAAEAAGLGSRWFTWRTSRKTANATMMKLINVFKNTP